MSTDNNILSRLKMTKLKRMQMGYGYVWEGIVELDGKPFCWVSNDGNGGCNMYHPAPGSDVTGPVFRAAMKDVEAAAAEATGCKIEAFDWLTACMDNNWTAADAVARVRTEMEESS